MSTLGINLGIKDENLDDQVLAMLGLRTELSPFAVEYYLSQDPNLLKSLSSENKAFENQELEAATLKLTKLFRIWLISLRKISLKL